jgi:3-hydroxyacyl-[acyl-carrier-protein] dehydratase
MELTREGVTQLIPHRYPFLFLDGVTGYEPDKSADGFKIVTSDEPFFQANVAGKPVMPGPIITEALAQLACVFMSLQLGDKAQEMTPLFLGIDNARFHKPVEPGARLDMRIDVLLLRRGMGKVRGVARVDGELAAEAELTCMMK